MIRGIVGTEVSYIGLEVLCPYVMPSPVEVSGSSMGAGVSQTVIEALVDITSNNAFINQTCIEVLWTNGDSENPTPPASTVVIGYSYVS